MATRGTGTFNDKVIQIYLLWDMIQQKRKTLMAKERKEIISGAKSLSKRKGAGAQVELLYLHGSRNDLYCGRKNNVNNKVTGGWQVALEMWGYSFSAVSLLKNIF